MKSSQLKLRLAALLIAPVVPFLHWWPRNGTTEWVQYDFKKEETVSLSEWKPVVTGGSYIIEKDRFCTLVFKPVRTMALRLEVPLVSDFSAGMYEWKVE